MKPKSYTPTQLAEILGITRSGVHKQLEKGEYPNAYWCECGKCKMIPASDIKHPADVKL